MRMGQRRFARGPSARRGAARGGRPDFSSGKENPQWRPRVFRARGADIAQPRARFARCFAAIRTLFMSTKSTMVTSLP